MEGGEPYYAIERPWNDESLVIGLPRSQVKIIADALNPLFLPQRFSAVWHSDSKDFEVVWTAYKLSNAALDLANRSFVFNFENRDYNCEFGESSSRLATLAKFAFPIRGSEFGHRNLSSFHAHAHVDDDDLRSRLDKPRSFWIRNLEWGGEWNEDEAVRLAYHLNFYMSYFDDKTSKIIIHPTSEVTTAKPQHRYIAGKFPRHIRASAIDPNVLHFWNAAHGADDQAKSFLYYYRLIEYSASAYINQEARAAVKRLLSQPDALDDIARSLSV